MGRSLEKETTEVAKLENVQSGIDGRFSGKLDGHDVEFGKINEPPASRVGAHGQQDFFASGYWWLTTTKNPEEIYVLRTQPKEGRNVDLDMAVTVVNRDALSL